MNRAIGAIWISMLLATVLGVVPLVVSYLMRLLAAARQIEEYTGEMLRAGVGVAGNTANVAALKDTIAVAPQLLAGAESLERHAMMIETALAAARPGNGHVTRAEVGP
jgi:hypothetical protein